MCTDRLGIISGLGAIPSVVLGYILYMPLLFKNPTLILSSSLLRFTQSSDVLAKLAWAKWSHPLKAQCMHSNY